jgi:hypothetical protein
MKPAPTLIDEVYRASFRNETNPGWRNNATMRHALEGARRFTMDEPMARFMAELANESFLRSTTFDSPLAVRIADSLRVSARLPHESIWIEYPLRAYQYRSCELRGERLTKPSEVPWREGWLIQQHPKIDSAHIVHMFNQADDITESSDGFRLWTFPLAMAWCSDDSPLPWQLTVDSRKPDGSKGYVSRTLVGLGGYERDNVNCVRSSLIDDPFHGATKAYADLLLEWTGTMRRIWALLATIDHLPIIKGEVRQSKGFLARGRIRKFLDHQTITLNVPAKKDTRVIARQMIAIAHRKRHEVRAHWRDDWRNPPSRRCNPHLWECVDDNADLIRCELCHGRQFYIHKHERGDASLGYVTHSYVLRHEVEADK